MKRLLTLLALAGLSAAAGACGDDSGDNNSTNNEKDAGNNKADSAAPAPRGQQITNLAAECTENSECKGSGAVTCVKEIGGGLGGGQPATVPGGYCTAQCNYTSECGANGACPVGAIAMSPTVAQLGSVLGGAGTLSSLFPQQCYETCTVGDAGGRGTCSRADHVCSSITALLSAQGAPAQFSGLLSILGPIPELSLSYCFPPIQVPAADGGVGDGGAATRISGGLDAGN